MGPSVQVISRVDLFTLPVRQGPGTRDPAGTPVESSLVGGSELFIINYYLFFIFYLLV